MSEYLKNEYIIKVGRVKDSVKVKVLYNLKLYSIYIDNKDTYGNTNCENNVTLSLNSDLYTFINNCLNKKDNYNYQIINNDEYLEIYLTFKYEMFDFNYIVSLDLE